MARRNGVVEGKTERAESKNTRGFLGAVILVIFLVGSGYLLSQHLSGTEQRKVDSTEFDEIVVALRENRNRLEVYRLSGKVTTNASVFGGWADIFHGKLTVRQPWSVAYFVNMGDLTLDDYIWDKATRTLIVRAPAVTPDPPNIDESKQVVDYDGPIITRDMQTRLRNAIANGAKKQAADEAGKPDNLAAANRAARAAIVQNLKGPLSSVGVRNVSIVVRTLDAGSSNKERWDVSRSIAEVLAERASR